jgi:hypothetical protein
MATALATTSGNKRAVRQPPSRGPWGRKAHEGKQERGKDVDRESARSLTGCGSIKRCRGTCGGGRPATTPSGCLCACVSKPRGSEQPVVHALVVACGLDATGSPCCCGVAAVRHMEWNGALMGTEQEQEEAPPTAKSRKHKRRPSNLRSEFESRARRVVGNRSSGKEENAIHTRTPSHHHTRPFMLTRLGACVRCVLA